MSKKSPAESLLRRLRLVAGKAASFIGSKVFFWAVAGAFAVQGAVLAVVTKFGVPPDETNHIRFIDFYAQHSLGPWFSEQAPTYNLGDKTREVDYLYHYVMSLIERVLPFSDTVEHSIIRFLTVGFALLTFFVLARVFKRLAFPQVVINVTLLVYSTIAMVLMMSSAVNNDVFVWLGVALGLLLVLRIWESPRLLDVLALLSIAAYGGLIKRTLLPVSLAFVIFGLGFAVRRWRDLLTQARRADWRVWAMVLVLLVGVGLSAERIGGNVLHYGHIVPTCEEVQGTAACKDFWWNKREAYLATLPPERQVPLPEYIPRWFGESFYNILDIQTQGWRHEVQPPAWLSYALMGFLAVGGVYGVFYETRRFKIDPLSRRRLFVAMIGVYAIIFHLAVNYSEYLRTHVWGIALNGRYILAGLLPLVGLAVFYWWLLLARRPRLRWVVAVGGIVLLAWGSGLYLLLRNPQLLHG